MPRETHIPFTARRSCGALYENVHSMGVTVIKLSEAALEGSASKMQFAAEELSDMASRARVLAAALERQLAQHRRRNPLAGMR